jgi:hypothetical protein
VSSDSYLELLFRSVVSLPCVCVPFCQEVLGPALRRLGVNLQRGGRSAGITDSHHWSREGGEDCCGAMPAHRPEPAVRNRYPSEQVTPDLAGPRWGSWLRMRPSTTGAGAPEEERGPDQPVRHALPSRRDSSGCILGGFVLENQGAGREDRANISSGMWGLCKESGTDGSGTFHGDWAGNSVPKTCSRS